MGRPQGESFFQDLEDGVKGEQLLYKTIKQASYGRINVEFEISISISFPTY